jgi:glucosamine 6-phosphate synthetase-like amidotransferase/phosphosugar isomerase protein
MCGIMGFVVVTAGKRADGDLFTKVVKANVSRGSLGYGAWTWSRGVGSYLVRETAEINPELAVQAARLGTVCAIHTRAPTGGQNDDLDNIHPFAIGRFLVAHNGLLLNWQDETPATWMHDADHGRLAYTEVDSAAIAAGIQYHFERGSMVADAIGNTMEALEGQAGCWLWDDATKWLYLWRVMSTIYTRRIDGVYYFSSAMVEGIFDGNDLLVEGTVVRLAAQPNADIDFSTGISVLRKFEYKSPYGVV